MTKNNWFFAVGLFCIVVIGVGLRLYKIDGPVADWHSWRQADTAAVARNYLRFGVDPGRPRYDDLSNIQSGKDNPAGYRMVEFPLYQLIAVIIEKVSGLSTELSLRLLSIAASVGTAVLLAALLRQVSNQAVGLTAGIIYSILPYSVYYGRSILPDVQMVFWSILSIACLWWHFSGQAGRRLLVFSWLLSAIAAAAAFLSKPMAIFLLLPAFYLFVKNYNGSKRWWLSFVGYAAIGVLPLLVWRQWIMQFPEGIPAATWLLNANNIRFKGAWFYWLFAKRFGELILGYWGLAPFVLGILVPTSRKEGWLLRWFLIGALLYIVIFAAGNVQHDYYQILLLPVLVIYLSRGYGLLLSSRTFSRISSYFLSFLTVVFMLMFSWYTVRTYYWINHPEIIEAGRAADKLLPVQAKVIAPYNGDTTFLYHTGRQGWPLGFEIDKKIQMGATHYVTVSPTDADLETRDLANKYTVVVRNDKYAIIDLTSLKP